MTSRERQASGGVTLAAPPASALPRAASAAADRPLPQWEDLYRSATPEQQAELLALAARQGLVYAHQLPAADPTAPGQRRQLLSQLLVGKPHDLQPVAVPSVEVGDEALDETQREAVARALGTPDLCLIQGAPGSGKSRVVAEIVIRAAARGERVLLLAPHAAAVDRVLELAGRRDVLCPVRCLGRDGRADDVPESVRPFTFAERIRSLRETTVQAVRADLAALDEQLRILRGEQATWDELEKLASCQDLLEGKLNNLARRRAGLSDELQHALATAHNAAAAEDAESFQARVLACRREHDREQERLAAESKTIQARRDEIARKRQQASQEYDRVRPFAEARRQSRWWTLAWWGALFHKEALPRYDELSARLKALEQEETECAVQAERLEAERARCEATHKEKLQQLLDAETARRERELARDETELRQEAALIRAEWDKTCARLNGRTPAPDGPGLQAVSRARAAWQALLDDEEQKRSFSQRWADCLAEASETLPARLTHFANLVAATTDALAGDPHFGDGSAAGMFDLLILEDAHQVTESELLGAARRARRWVLVGEPALPAAANPTPGTAAAQGRGHGRSNRPASLRPGFFQRLWQQLHPTPARLPFAWVRAEGRLCCRLRPVTAEQQQWVEKEPLADCPDIELHILAQPRTEPVLAEVRFPTATPIRQAKQHIHRELQEVPAHCRGQSLAWHETESAVRLQVGLGACGWTCCTEASAEAELISVSLDGGIEERVRLAPDDPVPFETLGFEFSRGAGWTRQRAEEWAARHLNLRDLGRTVFLERPHRARGRLAGILGQLLAGHASPRACRQQEERGPGAWHGWSAPLELRPVPAPAAGEPRKRGPDARGARPRGGAGFELDLSDSAHSEHLPGHLRPLLPRRGLVNYFEAQAVVTTLEGLLPDAVFRADAAAWQAQHTDPALVVTALYPAQVQLLRHLIAQSAVLARAGLVRVGEGLFQLPGGEKPLSVQVEVPEALRQRECLALVLSLTRSHTHRAVTLGEDPSWLPLSLTRAAGRVLLFGDTGTLARRTQWAGALDHLDETAAVRERELVAHLLRHVQGRHSSTSPVCASTAEGSA